MQPFLTDTERKKIHKALRKKYKKVAQKPNGLFKYPTGRAGLEALQYPSELIHALPAAITDSYCGVGNPFTLGPINQGEAVLDIGCGCGVDAILAAMMTGASGRIVGIDIIPEMLNRAKENLALTELQNVAFEKSAIDNLPFAARDFDAIISNGSFNLVLDKSKALSEVYRVLKPQGRLMIADQVLSGEVPKEKNQIIKSWARWEGGAIPGKDFLAMLQKVGFKTPELVAKTGFNSSPKTEGVLIRAFKD